MFDFFAIVVGFLAGITALLAGFGIGNFLIPLVSNQSCIACFFTPFSWIKHSLLAAG